MTKFITTSTCKFITANNNKKVIPINLVRDDNFQSWSETLTLGQQRWVKSNHFTAQQNEVLYLADNNGNLIAIIIGSTQGDTDHLALYANLAKSLPDGHYRIDSNQSADEEQALKLSCIGWALSQYEFDHYKEQKNNHNAVLVLDNQQLVDEVSSIINGITLVRNLVNTPTCDMGPSHLSDVMEELAMHYSAKFSALVGDELLDNGFNTIHAVGRAAKNQPRLLELNWGRLDAPKLTLVGKGVCFDTGGLDMKSSSGMRMMKKDMGGSAHTLGIAQMIMEQDLDVRLRLLIPAVENNISADAFRPGDIITTYKGTTVEVDNTDAEGRLVLCDALALASEEDPDLLINFATLTGAARVAMGTELVPFFTDSDQLATELYTYAEKEQDPIWRMPLFTPYAKQLKSTSADMRNMGSGPLGSAIVAALYLKHFVINPAKWVHFDLYAWNVSEKPICPEGGEAMAIRAVFAYLKNRFS